MKLLPKMFSLIKDEGESGRLKRLGPHVSCVVLTVNDADSQRCSHDPQMASRKPESSGWRWWWGGKVLKLTERHSPGVGLISLNLDNPSWLSCR